MSRVDLAPSRIASSPQRPFQRRRLLPAMAAIACLVGCGNGEQRGDRGVQVRLELDPASPMVGPVRVVVHVADDDWTPRNGARVVLRGARDGIELAVDTAQGQGAGRYEAPSFGFEVAGEWLLTTRVDLPDGRWVELDRTVSVGGG